jgi:hypothetical protein
LFINELYTVLDLADRFSDSFGLLQHWARTAASFRHQVAAGVKDMLYNFCAVKMHKNASKAREKIRTYLKFL